MTFTPNKTIISFAAVLWNVNQHTLPLLGWREKGALCDIPANGYEEDYLNYGFFSRALFLFHFVLRSIFTFVSVVILSIILLPNGKCKFIVFYDSSIGKLQFQ